MRGKGKDARDRGKEALHRAKTPLHRAGQGGRGRDRADRTRWGLSVGQGATGRCTAALVRLQQMSVEAKIAV